MAKASIVLLAIIFVSQAFGGDYVALVKPEAVGLSSARLERIDNLINKHIEGGVLGVALNEVELMPEDYLGHLHLTPGTYLKIEVSDTGHGILPEIKEKAQEWDSLRSMALCKAIMDTSLSIANQEKAPRFMFIFPKFRRRNQRWIKLQRR